MSDVVRIARGYVGTPFRHQGRLPGIALDCAGAALLAAVAAGYEAHDLCGYPRHPARGMLRRHLDEQPCLVPVMRAPRTGDLLLMTFGREPQHVAICAGHTIIHAYEVAGKVCEHVFSDEWKRRVVSVYEFIGEKP